jgi:hypothetical protein
LDFLIMAYPLFKPPLSIQKLCLDPTNAQADQSPLFAFVRDFHPFYGRSVLCGPLPYIFIYIYIYVYMHTACCTYYKGPCLFDKLKRQARPDTTKIRLHRLANDPRLAYRPPALSFCFFHSGRPSSGPRRSHGSSNSAAVVASSAASGSYSVC